MGPIHIVQDNFPTSKSPVTSENLFHPVKSDTRRFWGLKGGGTIVPTTCKWRCSQVIPGPSGWSPPSRGRSPHGAEKHCSPCRGPPKLLPDLSTEKGGWVVPRSSLLPFRQQLVTLTSFSPYPDHSGAFLPSMLLKTFYHTFLGFLVHVLSPPAGMLGRRNQCVLPRYWLAK